MNVCTLYHWSARMESRSDPVRDCYADFIDHICRR
jgi:hypothetical protein